MGILMRAEAFKHKGRALPARSWVYPLLILLVWLASRWWALSRGAVCFQASGIFYGCQVLDLGLLKNNLIESIFYLHCQPPLFNILLGLGLKLFGSGFIFGFQVLYLLFGLALGQSLFQVLARLRIPPGLAFLLTIVFLLSPGCVLFENYLFYTYPITLLLILSALGLHRLVIRKDFASGLIFFSLLAALVLIRNVFHLAWFLLVLILVLFFSRVPRRRVLAAAFLPLLLLCSLYLKNLLVFGYPAASTSLGMSLYHVAAGHISETDRQELAGKFSPEDAVLVRLPPEPTMKPFRAYKDKIRLPEHLDIPVLADPDKADGNLNGNYVGYLAVGKRLTRISLRLIGHRPAAYLKSLGRAWLSYFQPAHSYFKDQFEEGVFLVPGSPSTWYHIYDDLLLGRDLEFPGCPWFGGPGQARLPLVILLPLLFGYGVWASFRRQRHYDPAEKLVILYVCACIANVSLVANLFSMGENMRHRFVLEPFFLLLLGLLLRDLGALMRRKGR